MDVHDRTAEPDTSRLDRRRARAESLGLAVIATLVVGAGVIGLWVSATTTIRSTYLGYVAGVARMGALLVDPQLHDSIRDPAQLNGPDYVRAVEPLRRLRRDMPDVRYIYTVVREDNAVRFVLDAADPGAKSDTGIPDQSGVWEPIDHAVPSPALLAALGDGVTPGVAGASSRAIADNWGIFISGFAPMVDASGRQFGVLGVDIRSDVYLARMHSARRWALLGLAPAVLLILVLALGYYRFRLRMLQSARHSAAATREALASQLRLRSVIDGTGVGVWEAQIDPDTGSDRGTVDAHWAAMLGLSAEALNPMSFEFMESRLTHPDDRALARQAMELSLRDAGRMVAAELRMRHADGRWIWVEVRGKVVERDTLGRPLRMVGTQMDISERKAMELTLKDSEANFRSLFELSPVGIVLVDYPTGRFLEVNDSLLASTGFSREELLQRTYMDITPERWHEFERLQASALERGAGAQMGPYEKEYQRKDGSCYPVMISGIRIREAAGRDMVWAIAQDISDRKAMENELVEAARRDRLTGLANRTLFLESLQASVDRVRRGLQSCHAVLFLDFDRFKLVNDAMGHEAGDGLLREIAQRLQDSLHGIEPRLALPGASLVARFGGDEFLVLMNDIGEEDAERIAERLLVSLSRTYKVHGREVYSTASIGIVVSGEGMESADAVVRNADVAMYEAKRSGRACAVLFNEVMRTRLTRHVTVESGLRKALGTQELSLVYQPIIELRSGRMSSVEALCRWRHPQLGDVSPTEFIPVAEESGLIITLGQWVLQEACSALAKWRRIDPARAPATISVNISRAELALGDRLLARVKNALEDAGLPPGCLQLEVTEREVMRDPQETLRLMRQLRELGVRFAMDDFGTGTSSLGCLRDYPFDVIKIDRSFVQDVISNPDVLAVIHATVTLVENLGRTSVAEGVEQREQVAVLQSLGCHYAQGYYFSHPMTAQQMRTYMSTPAAVRA